MTSEHPATTGRSCNYPGCTQPVAAPAGPGRPPEYCEGRGHTKVTAWRERRRLAAAAAGTATAADTDRPGLVRVEGDRVECIAGQVRDAVATLTYPTAAEAEVEAARAAAEQRAAAAEARAAAAEQRAAEEGQWRAEADAAAEEMAAQLAAAE